MQMSSTISFLHPPTTLVPPAHTLTATTPQAIKTPSFTLIVRAPKTSIIKVSSSDQTVPIESPTSLDADGLKSGSDVVRGFYQGINGHDVVAVEDLIADNCVYEDLTFPSPFVGRKEVMEFFKKFLNTTSRDLQFVIDDISAGDSSCVGVTWHLEWKGNPFPFSKGCSFYRLQVMNGKRQIVYGRDIVEPAIKLGDTALVAIRGVTWLLQQFPQLAEQLR
ncbi:SnoaL_2 domain-containing protein [Cephalotus follicularis]|uniref:SnoaL_2 domain-containing protein n=1 Tax=Cephalotus follicularis TaxID=3775 RepID=A0A1Q3B9J2_CEPFO|nr:SnoaL_2 domain-containing protein [Cephalotus follicularis]